MQKKVFSIQFLIFLLYELSACPLLLNFNKVYFASSLIARPNTYTVYIPLILEPFLEAIPQVVIALVYQCHIAFTYNLTISKI